MAMTDESESNGVSAAASNPNHHSYSPREIKLAGDSTDGVDFISSLPDPILHSILSFIPTKLAIRTSVLSKRWKRVWHETPSISFDCYRHGHVDSIDKTLSSYSALKITSFDVRIRYNMISTMHVDRWIELAMSRNAENLSLELESYGDFPDFFYVNPSLKKLRLTMGHGRSDLDPKCTVSWTSLRNLSLKYCTLSDESIANILSGCPMLETLKLNLCAENHRIDLSRSGNLTRLEIIGDRFLGPAEIDAPHIHYLRLTNFLKLPTLVDVSSLTEANFNIGYYSGYGIMEGDFLQDMVLKMLAKLQNVDKLTIGAVVLQILSLAELHGVPFPQLKIKALTVETMLVRSVIPGITRLLQNSPGLKKITVYTKKCKAILDDEIERYLNTHGLNNDRCWSMFFPTVEETSLSLNPGHVVLFMERVLWNAKTLETMVLRLGGYLNATDYQFLLSMVAVFSRNTLANLNSFKIIP